ncbi:MAG: hypothetical protein SCK57_06155 [Bacillota bacterium]|nr:hypothetical protein [Bacillota bacterium]MDW7677227.1 hypothetical protein [Bacillota bacterium]
MTGRAGIVGWLLSVLLERYHDQFRTVMDPQGEKAVSQSAAQVQMDSGVPIMMKPWAGVI